MKTIIAILFVTSLQAHAIDADAYIKEHGAENTFAALCHDVLELGQISPSCDNLVARAKQGFIVNAERLQYYCGLVKDQEKKLQADAAEYRKISGQQQIDLKKCQAASGM